MELQKIYSGDHSINELPSILANSTPKHILLVTGKDSFQSSQAQNLLEPLLKDYSFTRFSDFTINPKIEDINKGIALFKEKRCDFVIGIGGGTVLDIAKAISVLHNCTSSTIEYVKKSPSNMKRDVPNVMIPTTTGTGSESTQFCVVYINKQKFSLEHKTVLPEYAILDPRLVMNIPAPIAASSGMDALCQAIEAFWSVHSTNVSEKISQYAIQIILDNIKPAILDSSDKSKVLMLQASNLAGQAINIARTTAAHAASYPMTSYFNIPHGTAVAMTLPSFIKFNAEVDGASLQDERGLEHVNNTMTKLLELLGVSNADEAKEKITTLMADIGLETRLSRFLNSRDDLKVILENGFDPQRVVNNPRVVTKDDLSKIINDIY